MALVAALRDGRHHLQRVDVEKSAAVEREAGQDVVIQRALQHVGVFTPQFQFEHPPRAQHHADGGAGLGVGAVGRQIEGFAELLAVRLAAHAADEVEVSRRDGRPEGAALRGERRVAPVAREVDHRGQQIHHPHRVPHRLGQFAHGARRLQRGQPVMVHVPGQLAGFAAALGFGLEIIWCLPALGDEVRRQLAVALHAGGAGELHEGELDFLMPAVTGQLAGAQAKGAANQVGQPADHIEQRPLAGGGEMRDARLDEMPGNIQLVTVAEIGPAVLRLDELEIGVEVAIAALRLRNGRDEPVELSVERRVGMRGQPIAGRLDPLRQIRVLPKQPMKLPRLLAGGDLQVVHATAPLRARQAVVQRLPLVGNDRVPDQLRPTGEEAVVETHVRQRERCRITHRQVRGWSALPPTR